MNDSPEAKAPKPIDEEPTSEDQLTGHEYDGIQEYDNPLPRWWRRLFWGTFVFSLGYYVHYQLTGNGPSVEESYAQDMRELREMLASQALGSELSEEGLVKIMEDPALVRDGASVFQTRCVQCHADRGQGNIGPNLTDDYWLYGSGTLMDIYASIAEGRTTKGMPAWERTLRPMELGQVAAYVGSLRGTNVPGRPPQGTRVEPNQAGSPAPGNTPAAPDVQERGQAEPPASDAVPEAAPTLGQTVPASINSP